MYELPWFKTETNIFSNRKIQLILKLTDGDTYFRVWIQLIALAVECNNKGRLEIGGNNPMTIENFSKIMGKSKKKIEKILNKFLELEMLIKEGETFLIKIGTSIKVLKNMKSIKCKVENDKEDFVKSIKVKMKKVTLPKR